MDYKEELNTSGWNETMAAIFVFQLWTERSFFFFFFSRKKLVMKFDVKETK